ncbi:hypothetical protein L484_020843 [Morus notabilis]|uniref:Uncharacterized protein n=1 Tax=Morus notabilis TaxID=981085 RepID=W9QRL4_9ROSA|nr:hypothetical protein L484_020843 [Morus notabilis]
MQSTKKLLKLAKILEEFNTKAIPGSKLRLNPYNIASYQKASYGSGSATNLPSLAVAAHDLINCIAPSLSHRQWQSLKPMLKPPPMSKGMSRSWKGSSSGNLKIKGIRAGFGTVRSPKSAKAISECASTMRAPCSDPKNTSRFPFLVSQSLPKKG